MQNDCPHPIGDDDGTVRQCVERGHCACPRCRITKPEKVAHGPECHCELCYFEFNY